jgi:hypothetical protein
MPRCFVIQPFDNDEFDKRFDDVFVPAIRAAGLDPYRMDRDPALIIPIEAIEKNIRDADICVADISLAKPIVWFEVGYALASAKDVVLVCKRGSIFPFDVQHRTIIEYNTNSPRDFEALQTDLTERLLARSNKAQSIAELSTVKPTQGLTPHEIATLILVLQDRLYTYWGLTGLEVADYMERAGFTRAATILALEALSQKKLIELTKATDSDNLLYICTDNGVTWCMENQDKLKLTFGKLPPLPSTTHSTPQTSRSVEDDDDEIPPF